MCKNRCHFVYVYVSGCYYRLKHMHTYTTTPPLRVHPTPLLCRPGGVNPAHY